jgi:hypothetical protein
MSLFPEERKSQNQVQQGGSKPDFRQRQQSGASEPEPLDSARFLKKIRILEKELESQRQLLSKRTRQLRDVIYRLEAEGDVRWCEDCDTVHAIDEDCQCPGDDSPCLTDSERNR